MTATLNTRSFMKNITRYLGLVLKLLVFLLVLGFALKNSHTVIFYAYWGQVWQAPLIIMLGLAFISGVLTGVLALLPTVFRLRREAARKLRAGELDSAVTQSDMPVV
jgi:putative membrane protein